jgi:ribosome-binding protein aMBF1 (putative translation factor)
MIRTDSEYEGSVGMLAKWDETIKREAARIAAKGYTPEQIEAGIAPKVCFRDGIKSEVESYQRLKRGDFNELNNYASIGQILCAARIACGLSQRQLAEKMGVHETQVSRDERNEYHSITVDRANRILEAMGLALTLRVKKIPSMARSKSA